VAAGSATTAPPDVQYRIVHGRRQRCAEPRVERLLVAEPLDHDPARVRRMREHDVMIDARRDAHSVRFEELDGRVDVGDLHRDRAHVGAESAYEAIDRAVGDDRFTDLDGVVAHPGHPAPAADRGVVEATVLQHPEPDECDERVAGAFVVGDHRCRVEAPANSVRTRRHAGVSLTCWAP
jgi:hypothetical protein